MTHELKAEPSQFTREDLFNIEVEEQLIKQFIEIALAPSDNSWTKHNTKNEDIHVEYKYLPNNTLCTIRGSMIIQDMTVDSYSSFSEVGYQAVYDWEKSCDPMCTESSVIKCIDANHEVLYCSYDSRQFLIAVRDFCNMRMRRKLLAYEAADGRKYDISCTLNYSIDDKHPLYKSKPAKNVRGFTKYGGIVVAQELNENGEKINAAHTSYVLYIDPRGWLPEWAKKMFAPQQGMVIKQIAENWPKVEQIMEERKKNNYKREHKLMFAVKDIDIYTENCSKNANIKKNNNQYIY